MPVGYEEAELKALNRVIAIAAEYMSSSTDENEDDEVLEKIPQTEDFAPCKVLSDEKVILKEFIRNNKSKLVMSKEHGSDHHFISFQYFYDQQGQWKTGQKTRIRLSELPELLSILSKEVIEL